MNRWMIGITVGTLLAVGYVHERVVLIRTGYRVEELRQTREALRNQSQVLQYNVFALRSPVVLEKRLSVARVQLAPPLEVVALQSQLDAELSGAGALENRWLEPIRKLSSRWRGVTQTAMAQPNSDSSETSSGDLLPILP